MNSDEWGLQPHHGSLGPLTAPDKGVDSMGLRWQQAG
jgi:hypothetical protein